MYKKKKGKFDNIRNQAASSYQTYIHIRRNMIYLITINSCKTFKISETFVEIGKYFVKFYDQNFTFQAISLGCFSRKKRTTTFVEYLLNSDPKLWALHVR